MTIQERFIVLPEGMDLRVQNLGAVTCTVQWQASGALLMGDSA